MTRTRFSTIGIGGTFDHFHKGHADLITFAAQISDRLVLGITDDTFALSKKFPHSLEPYEDRVRSVKKFCQKAKIQHVIHPLHDRFGPSIEPGVIDALVVTQNTIKNAEKINEVRKRLRLTELPIIICPLTRASSGAIISSTNIRSGHTNREGVPYIEQVPVGVPLSDMQRKEFSHPQGPIVQNPSSALYRCVVGDVCLHEFRSKHWQYNLGVYDLMTARVPTSIGDLTLIQPDAIAANTPGTIGQELISALLVVLEKKAVQHLRIFGEEDLVAVALALLLPLNSKVYYGQPNVGMVEMKITETLKQQIVEILST